MEVIKKPRALLSNYEVLKALQEVKKNSRLKGDQKNLATVTYEAIKYLEETPCVHQSEDSVTNFLKAIKEKGFRLTKGEKLQIVNSRPSNLVELQLLIEENEERFSEEALNTILSIVQEHLPNPDQESANQESQDPEMS
ncbi:RNA polymerase III subunit I [Brevipalpus obovatus]|uniref:RNA polymerase III subunit I n=1 Tax=Brevipalpus obovatus TaxID=246614 RepID=UPI003D9DBF4D